MKEINKYVLKNETEFSNPEQSFKKVIYCELDPPPTVARS